MKDGDFFSKIKRLLLNVTKLHRHVFENPGYKISDKTSFTIRILYQKTKAQQPAFRHSLRLQQLPMKSKMMHVSVHHYLKKQFSIFYLLFIKFSKITAILFS